MKKSILDGVLEHWHYSPFTEILICPVCRMWQLEIPAHMWVPRLDIEMIIRDHDTEAHAGTLSEMAAAQLEHYTLAYTQF